MIDAPERVYRVTVRGRFADLDERAQRHLEAEQANHDIFRSAFTAEGTLTYELATGFFNLRYEIRTAAGEEAAAERARAEAGAFLATLKFNHGPPPGQRLRRLRRVVGLTGPHRPHRPRLSPRWTRRVW